MIERLVTNHNTPPAIDDIAQQLREYEYADGKRIERLEERVERGLDPAGLLAVRETREKVARLAEAYGADMSEVDALTAALHTGGVWQHASELASDSPAATVWVAMGEATVRDKAEITDKLDEAGFLADYARINETLDRAVERPAEFREEAREHLINRAKEQFRLDDGVPISDKTEGFLAMAVLGHKSGVVVADNELMFVGAKELDFDGFAEDNNLRSEVKEQRGREVQLYVTDSSEEVVKKLYPGFGIVLSGDLEMAKDLARWVVYTSEEQ